MKWSEIIEDETLQNLPFKIELNEWGNVVMSPASNLHGAIQTAIASLLTQLKGEGVVISECSLRTSKGVKVADVVWISADFFSQNGVETPYNVAPELCVEIVSPSNSDAEMAQKRDLYLAKGAREVWTCSLEGRVAFFNHRGETERSALFSNFPNAIELPGV